MHVAQGCAARERCVQQKGSSSRERRTPACAGQSKAQLCAAVRSANPDHRCLLGSVEHVELSRMLAEALAHYSAGEIGRPSGGGLGLNVGRFSQAREQAL